MRQLDKNCAFVFEYRLRCGTSIPYLTNTFRDEAHLGQPCVHCSFDEALITGLNDQFPHSDIRAVNSYVFIFLTT
jgi:hypothetical protein